MSRLDELPPDQRATLSLLLAQRKTYAQVGALLAIPEQAVHDRAHAALAMLAPGQARELSAEQRQQVGDYLLGAQPVAERLRTRSYLAGSQAARAWAGALSEQLAPLMPPGGLPDIPPPAATTSVGAAVAQAPVAPPAQEGASERGASPPSQAQAAPSAAPAADAGAGGAASGPHATTTPGAPRSSRLGGAILLAAIAAAVIVAVVLLTGGSGAKKTPTTSATSTSTKSNGKEPKLENEIALTSSNPKSKTIGVVDVVSKEGKLVLLLEARNLETPKGFYYAIWLYNSPTSAVAVTESSDVKDHALGGLTGLPASAGDYHEILLTKETNPHPSGPGTIVLRGPFSLHPTESASPGS